MAGLVAPFHKLQTARLQDEAAERVRVNHHRAIGELQDRVEAVETQAACVGFALVGSNAGNQTTIAQDEVITMDTVIANSVPDLVKFESSGSNFALAPGYTYLLKFSALVFVTGTRITAKWYDIVEGAYVSGVSAYLQANDIGDVYSDQPVAMYAVKATRWRRFDVRAAFIAGSPSIEDEFVWATVEVFRS